jgi:hypothetical protein
MEMGGSEVSGGLPESVLAYEPAIGYGYVQWHGPPLSKLLIDFIWGFTRRSM